MSHRESVDAARLREELAEEFAHHIKMIEQSEIAAGASPDAARERALQRFGDQERAAHECARIMRGAWHMGNSMKIARIVGVSVWRVGVAASLGFCVLLGWSANRRAIEASNMAAATAAATRTLAPDSSRLPAEQQAAILSSIWGPTSGAIEVRGAVNSPGSFHTDIRAPLDLASLIERAGGATPGARLIIWNQRGEPGDLFVTLANAQRFRGDFNGMPAPGSIITVK